MEPLDTPILNPGKEAEEFLRFVRKLFVHCKKSLKKALFLLEINDCLKKNVEDTILEKKVRTLTLKELISIWKIL